MSGVGPKKTRFTRFLKAKLSKFAMLSETSNSPRFQLSLVPILSSKTGRRVPSPEKVKDEKAEADHADTDEKPEADDDNFDSDVETAKDLSEQLAKAVHGMPLFSNVCESLTAESLRNTVVTVEYILP